MLNDLVLAAVPSLAAIMLGAALIDLCRLLEHKPRHVRIKEEAQHAQGRSPATRSR